MSVVLDWVQETLTLVVKGSGVITKQTEYTNAKVLNITGSFHSTADGAFQDYQSLEEIYLPDTIVYLGNSFIYLTKIKQIFIPRGLQEIIMFQPFDYNYYLHDFIVDANNQNFSAIDGVLFSKDHKQMMFYPTGRKESTYSIPEGTETLFRYVFDSCEALMHIIIPTTLSSAKGIASNLPNLQSVIVLRSTKDPLPNVIEEVSFFELMDSYNGGIKYSYNYFTYSIILDKRLVISPCTRNGVSYCSFNITIFSNNKQIEEIIINEGITAICRNAFSGCTRLNTLSIPSTLNEVCFDSFSFTGLGKCSKVIYPISKYSLLLSSGIPRIAFLPCLCTKRHPFQVIKLTALLFSMNILSK